MVWPGVVFVLIFYLTQNGATTTVDHKVRNRHIPHIQDLFIGEIRQNSRTVNLDPPLFAVDKDAPKFSGMICGYELYPDPNGTKEIIPFIVKVVNKKTGKAIMRLKPGFDLNYCDASSPLKFEISAVDCGVRGRKRMERKSPRSPVEIHLEGVNQFSPHFENSNYSVNVDGRFTTNQPLVSLHAEDEDCSPKYGKICRYSVLDTQSDMFTISADGVLVSKQNVKARGNAKKFVVAVVAIDCGHRKSKPIHVTIVVNPDCKAKWTGIPSRVELASLKTNSVPIFPKASLSTCMSDHDLLGVDTSVTLDLEDVESLSGCNGESYTTENTKIPCDKNYENILELTPSSSQYEDLRLAKSYGETNPNELPTIQREASTAGRRIFDFNGVNQVLPVDDDITMNKLDSLDLLSNYSISFRMYVGRNTTNGQKQTILSKSDSTGLSRQHLTVYLHKCHLMILIRNERSSNGGDLKPAEWHWKLPAKQECWERWYTVLFSVEFPNVTLFVDGVQLTPFLIADDYPLHKANLGSKWVIGASWGGRSGEYSQQFFGKISDFIFYVGHLENTSLMKCLRRCMEGISPSDKNNQLSVNSTMTFNPAFRLTASSNGSDVTSMTQRLNGFVYFNNRRFPAPGPRRIRIETKLRCSNDATKCSVVPTIETYVMVVAPPDPGISLTGVGHIARSASVIASSRSVHPFQNISCVTGVDVINHRNPANINLDRCVIKELYDVGMAGRFGISSKRLFRKSNLNLEIRSNGIVIRGIQTLGMYEKVLRSVTYKNPLAHQFQQRTFTVQCSQLNQRYHSNTYRLVMTILKSPIPSDRDGKRRMMLMMSDQPHPVALVASRAYSADLAEVQSKLNNRKLSPESTIDHSFDFVTPSIVIGSCVGLMALLVVAAVLHARARVGDEELFFDNEDEGSGEGLTEEKEIREEDLDWDDSAMTITVNPMEADDVNSCSDFSEIEDDDVAHQGSDVMASRSHSFFVKMPKGGPGVVTPGNDDVRHHRH